MSTWALFVYMHFSYVNMHYNYIYMQIIKVTTQYIFFNILYVNILTLWLGYWQKSSPLNKSHPFSSDHVFVVICVLTVWTGLVISAKELISLVKVYIYKKKYIYFFLANKISQLVLLSFMQQGHQRVLIDVESSCWILVKSKLLKVILIVKNIKLPKSIFVFIIKL